MKVSQLGPTLENPWTIQSTEFSRPEYWSGKPFPSPWHLPKPGVKLRSPSLQADSLPAEPQGKESGDKLGDWDWYVHPGGGGLVTIKSCPALVTPWTPMHKLDSE